MYQNPIYICISWCSTNYWFLVKKCWCQQDPRDVSRDLYIFCVFLREDITVLSFIILGYVWQIFKTGGQKALSPLPIREQPWKSPSWTGLKQPGFTYSACGPFIKNKERIEKFMQTGNTHFIYKNELDKACFQHDMAYGKTKDLVKWTQS